MKPAIGAAALLCALSASAQAQDSTPPPSNPPAYSSYGGGGHGKLGFGGIAYMGGTTGLSFAYDPGPWHIDTLLGYTGVNDTDVFSIGGRFWYHVKSSANADFSLGAGGSLRHTSPPGGGNSADEVFIEAGILVRVFLAPAVALSVGSGLVVGAADADGLGIGAGFNAVGLAYNAALHYYF
jgi:opacity protein-like surface antigen